LAHRHVADQRLEVLAIGYSRAGLRVSVIPGRDFGKSRTRISVITGQRFR
jgi:hypothetical protein